MRPVDDLMVVPDRYLGMIPPEKLQSLSVAFGTQGAGLSDRFLKFARACARRGVTAIRTLGRGAFPQLAYSWDGLIPMDLVMERPRGRFSTIEFEDCYGQIVDTYKQYQRMSDGMTNNIASPP